MYFFICSSIPGTAECAQHAHPLKLFSHMHSKLCPENQVRISSECALPRMQHVLWDCLHQTCSLMLEIICWFRQGGERAEHAAASGGGGGHICNNRCFCTDRIQSPDTNKLWWKLRRMMWRLDADSSVLTHGRAGYAFTNLGKKKSLSGRRDNAVLLMFSHHKWWRKVLKCDL